MLLVVHYDRHLSPQFLSVEGLGHELAIASRDQQKAVFVVDVGVELGRALVPEVGGVDQLADDGLSERREPIVGDGVGDVQQSLVGFFQGLQVVNAQS